MAENDIYLAPTYIIDSDSPEIVTLVKNLCGEGLTDKEKAIKVFYFVRDQLRYNMYAASTTKESYRASEILKTGKGWCLSKAIVLNALARAAGIPSRFFVSPR